MHLVSVSYTHLSHQRLKEVHALYKAFPLREDIVDDKMCIRDREEPPFVATSDSPTRLTPELSNLVPTNPNLSLIHI